MAVHFKGPNILKLGMSKGTEDSRNPHLTNENRTQSPGGRNPQVYNTIQPHPNRLFLPDHGEAPELGSGQLSALPLPLLQAPPTREVRLTTAVFARSSSLTRKEQIV